MELEPKTKTLLTVVLGAFLAFILFGGGMLPQGGFDWGDSNDKAKNTAAPIMNKSKTGAPSPTSNRKQPFVRVTVTFDKARLTKVYVTITGIDEPVKNMEVTSTYSHDYPTRVGNMVNAYVGRENTVISGRTFCSLRQMDVDDNYDESPADLPNTWAFSSILIR
ncbi:MAG: hypothetical protein EHM35_02520 [Planctomycetaceae bacterium]|nr:MAG: hypothetical protein EHM35_02520 [Planctomycetaceae bacterium]